MNTKDNDIDQLVPFQILNNKNKKLSSMTHKPVNPNLKIKPRRSSTLMNDPKKVK